MMEVQQMRSVGGAVSCRAEVVSDIALLSRHLKPWQELSALALEPNPFYEPMALLPAIALLAASGEVQVLLIWAETPAGPCLAGLLPLRHFQPQLRIRAAARSRSSSGNSLRM